MFYMLRHGLRFKPDEGVAKLRENTARVAVVEVNAQTAEVLGGGYPR